MAKLRSELEVTAPGAAGEWTAAAELAEVEKMAEMGVVLTPREEPQSSSSRKGKGKAPPKGHIIFAANKAECESRISWGFVSQPGFNHLDSLIMFLLSRWTRIILCCPRTSLSTERDVYHTYRSRLDRGTAQSSQFKGEKGINCSRFRCRRRRESVYY